MRVSTSNQTLPLSYFALVFPTGIKADVRPLADRSPIIIICPTRCDTLVIHRFVPVPPFVIVSPFFFCPLPPVFIFIFFFSLFALAFFPSFFSYAFFFASLSLSLSLVATTINRLSTSLRASPTRGGSRMKESVRAFFFFSFLYVSTVSIRIPLPRPLPSFFLDMLKIMRGLAVAVFLLIASKLIGGYRQRDQREGSRNLNGGNIRYGYIPWC